MLRIIRTRVRSSCSAGGLEASRRLKTDVSLSSYHSRAISASRTASNFNNVFTRQQHSFPHLSFTSTTNSRPSLLTSTIRTLKQSLSISTFRYADLDIEQLPKPSRGKAPPSVGQLAFGTVFSDHMLECSWSDEVGWNRPKIAPMHSIELHPAAKVLHYGQALFEGLKAYRGRDDEIRLFRPDLNVERMLASSERLCLPAFDRTEFLRCLIRLVDIDREFVPRTAGGGSLYIRPLCIGTEPTLGLDRSKTAYMSVITGPVGAYYATGVKPVSLLADPRFVRAWPGGTGDKKLACNYAPTLAIQAEAQRLGLQQVLWLFGDDHQITEVGAMNVFVYMRGNDGQAELVTPPLGGMTILPGVTRRSVLDLCLEWNEFRVSERKITMDELSDAVAEGRLLEMFGTGTACVIAPIERIVYRIEGRQEELRIPTMTSGEQLHARIMRALTDIQYGIVEHRWSLRVDAYDAGT